MSRVTEMTRVPAGSPVRESPSPAVAAVVAAMLLAQAGLVVVTLRVHGMPGGWPTAVGLLAVLILSATAALLVPARRLEGGFEAMTRSPAIARLTVASVAVLIGVPFLLSRGGPITDEAVLLELSRLIGDEGYAWFFQRYADFPWLGNQHPPLAPMLFGGIIRATGFGLVGLRLVSFGLAVGVVVVTYELGRRLYGDRVGIHAALLVTAFPCLILMGATIHNDVALVLLALLSLLALHSLATRPATTTALAGGLAFGTGMLTKYHMVFMGPVYLAYLAVFGKLRSHWRHWSLALLVAICMTGAWLLVARDLGVFAAQQETVSRYSRSFVASGDAGGVRFMLHQVFLTLPRYLGLYTLPLLALGIHAVARERLRADVFVLLWIALYSAPIVLSIPDARYFLAVFPALALLAARGLPTLGRSGTRVVVLALFFSTVSLAMLEFSFIRARAGAGPVVVIGARSGAASPGETWPASAMGAVTGPATEPAVSFARTKP